MAKSGKKQSASKKKPAGKPAAKAAAPAQTKTVILPWIRIEDYKTMKSLVAGDMTLPETFMEWVQIKNQEFAKLQSNGIMAERSMVRPEAFDTWCKSKGAKRSEASLKAFATELAGK